MVAKEEEKFYYSDSGYVPTPAGLYQNAEQEKKERRRKAVSNAHDEVWDLEDVILPPEEFHEKVISIMEILCEGGACYATYGYGEDLIKNLLRALGYGNTIDYITHINTLWGAADDECEEDLND